MFEYFFILGTIFLILSGALDEFRVNKAISCVILSIVFVLSMLKDVSIKYTVYFSWAGAFIILLSLVMFLIMTKEHLSTLLYSATLGLLIWAVITLVPALDLWYFKTAMFVLIGSMLAGTYFQGAVISVFACLICDVFSMLVSMDIELITVYLFIGEAKTTVILSMFMPIMVMALAGKKKKQMLLEGANGAS